MKRNARFWAYVNGGPVKLTLRPGQRLTHCEGGPTEEGWSLDTTTWEYPADEAAVYREWCNDGCDCDGRLTRGGVERCDVDNLHSGNLPYHGESEADTWADVIWPQWEKFEDHGVYDEYAQAAGY